MHLRCGSSAARLEWRTSQPEYLECPTWRLVTYAQEIALLRSHQAAASVPATLNGPRNSHITNPGCPWQSVEAWPSLAPTCLPVATPCRRAEAASARLSKSQLWVRMVAVSVAIGSVS